MRSLAGGYAAGIWKPVFPDLTVREDIKIANDGQIAGAIRNSSPQWKAVLDVFVAEHRVGTTFESILKTRDFKSDKMLPRAYTPEDAENC